MVLAAQHEGLGNCIMGAPLEVEGDVRAFLGVTREDWKMVCGLVMGYPAHAPPVPKRQDVGRVVRLS
jgi:nitroreductase